jgi:Mg-chelatase subunit ChlD/osmotically-inducible protein OsmY
MRIQAMNQPRLFTSWALLGSALTLLLLTSSIAPAVAAPSGIELGGGSAHTQPPEQRREIRVPEGTIEAVLARDVTASAEPVSPTSEFPEDTEKIYLVLKSELAKAVSVQARWMAVNVEGMPPQHRLTDSRLDLNPGQRGVMQVNAPRGGLSPGDYRVEMAVGTIPVQALSFTVTPLLPPAVLGEPTEVIRGFNIALEALGGKVERATSEYNDTTWAAANVIDGTVSIREGGWASKDHALPQELVLSFYQTREALITAVVIDTTTPPMARDVPKHDVPKHVEVWTSTTSPTAGFSKVAGARLRPRAAEHVMTFPPTRAKYVKVAFVSSHGVSDAGIRVGEVKIIEAKEGAPSILSDLPKNLALPALGGAVVRFTSQRERGGVHQLVDGRTDTPGWQSADHYLPQEFVFAFHRDQVALIDQIILHPKTHEDPTTGPKLITVSVSAESPLDGFQEVGQFTLQQEAREQAFPIGRRARFVKLRILENFGGRSTSLGEVKVIEGAAADYESVVRTAPEATAVPRDAAPRGAMDEAGVMREAEPNGTPAEANALEIGRYIKGVIDPLGEKDYFRLAIPGTAPSALTLELLGRPNIRTSFTLLDADGKSLKRFDPGAVPVQQATLSWAVEPGEYVVQVTEPPLSMVLIWDTSGSMQGSTEDLRRAVEAYLDQVRPSERLNLIRFSRRETEVLLPEFTSDRERLKAALAGKVFADGATPFYDAVAKGIELLEGVEGNRAIVVMTDGADTSSRLDHPGFWRLLQEKRIRLYTIGLGSELRAYQPTIASSGIQVLRHVAMATNGRFFFAHTAEELQGLYQQIVEELGTLSTYYIRPTLSRGPGRLEVMATGVIEASAPPQLELILDASGSMKRKHGGRMMIDEAKDIMVQTIDGLPDDLQVALRIYGHRIRKGQPGDCQDSELVFPFGKIDKARLRDRVRGIRAQEGKTPLAYSLQQVARDFGTVPGEKMVILVTDGKEECRGNPSAVVSELLAKGLKVRLNIVGFALADEATKREMQRIADLTRGHFFDAKDAKALRWAIEQALAVPYDALDAAGSRVATGLTGQGAIAVPEGIYTVVVRAAGKPITIADVRIAHDQFTRVELKKEGQEVVTRVLGPVRRHEAPWDTEAKAAPSGPEPPPLQVPTGSPAQPVPQAPPAQSPETPGTSSSQVMPAADQATRLAQLLDEAQRLLADQKLTTPQGASAYDRYQEILRLDPKNTAAKEGLAAIARTYQQWGQTALKQADYAKAIQQYRRALSIDGRDVESYSALAMAYRKTGAYAEAVQAYRQALQLAPERSELRQALAEVHPEQVQKALRGRGLTGIEVQVDPKLRLTLTGSVNTPDEQKAAVAIARAQPGIAEVIDRLTNRTQSTIKAIEGGTFR